MKTIVICFVFSQDNKYKRATEHPQPPLQVKKSKFPQINLDITQVISRKIRQTLP